jgi:hypothetical protein
MKSRIMDENPTGEMASMAMMLYTVPRAIDRVDAVAVLPGLGERWRLDDATAAYDNNPQARRLLITGINGNELTFEQPTPDILREKYGMQREDGIRIQQGALHTKAQAEWLAATVEEEGVESMGLFISPYHLLRGSLTTLKAFIRHDVRIPIIPMPVHIAPSETIPEMAAKGIPRDAWGMLPAETARITEYQAKGDVATADELREYINWMWTQPILAK